MAIVEEKFSTFGSEHCNMLSKESPMLDDITQDVAIQISTDVVCLGVLLDSKRTLHCTNDYLSGKKCFYHLRQLNALDIFMSAVVA